ncbi:hypothetical protein, conserved [Babesia ovata]|uniref:Uncharacterized protein n=1 Tax=Babesia ovata TaxID=189622 RepID=A0A2H6K6K4_9APIC|nr:uncharacterized protein BOVATA_001010 [Babesia ovata]GBE58608.1 hypothetical protein, conserved [Babesia ovata]
MVRQPKKLTDCPENLRESIDWLIQLRHGNGSGLDKLAEALKKLIGDAIKNATESLEKRQKELECAEEYYSNFAGSHCQTLLNDIDKAKKSGDEKEISKAQSNYNGHYSEVHGSDSKRDTAKKDLKERQESLNNLKKSLTIFTEAGEECKNLLTNLCDGLQTFLGYDENSKGYTGSGIVYSDLDRLCDGVMSFLHGVLDGVRDDDDVPYEISMPFYICFLFSNPYQLAPCFSVPSTYR